jgi:hypothetical protein
MRWLWQFGGGAEVCANYRQWGKSASGTLEMLTLVLVAWTGCRETSKGAVAADAATSDAGPVVPAPVCGEAITRSQSPLVGLLTTMGVVYVRHLIWLAARARSDSEKPQCSLGSNFPNSARRANGPLHFPRREPTRQRND